MSFLTGQDWTPQFDGQVKVWRLGRKTSSFQKVQILKICWTSGPDVKSGRDFGLSLNHKIVAAEQILVFSKLKNSMRQKKGV